MHVGVKGPSQSPWRMGGATWSIIGLIPLVIFAFVLSMGPGAVHLSPAQTIAALLKMVGLNIAVPTTSQQVSVLWALRLPRAALALLVGSALGIAGATLQGVLRSRAAEISFLGLSGPAGMAALSISVLLRLQPDSWPGCVLVPLAASVASFAVFRWIRRRSAHRGTLQLNMMLLMGAGVQATAAATMALMSFLGPRAHLRSLTSWMLGALSHATWGTVGVTALCLFVASVGLMRLTRTLDAMSLGHGAAVHLGIDVSHAVRMAEIWVALLVGSAVAAAGTIGFVGLIAPLCARQLVESSHRTLLWSSALVGGGLLLLADLAGRSLAAPLEVPVGLLTAAVGAPVFIWAIATKPSEGSH